MNHQPPSDRSFFFDVDKMYEIKRSFLAGGRNSLFIIRSHLVSEPVMLFELPDVGEWSCFSSESLLASGKSLATRAMINLGELMTLRPARAGLQL